MADREPDPGDVLGGRYEILGELGRGGMATVYRGRDLRLERTVAVKVFRGGFAEAVDPLRIAQEMRLLAGVDHPNVVSVLDASRGDGHFGTFLVMELVRGDDLGALLHRARGPLSADFARRIVADVARALDALHAGGIVHRDVKPGNILVPANAVSHHVEVTAKLTDFGIAQMVDGASTTAPESILGTAAYLSPEQVRGARPQPASDIYALGLVLLETLTGHRAFPGPAAEAAMARLHRPPALPTDASPALADLLSRMTALDPAHRPPAREVAGALREQLAGRVTAPDAALTAPTPVAGLALATPMPLGPDATAPQPPTWTPPHGTAVPAMTLTGSTPRIPAPPKRGPRRFPTVLVVAASALAATLAGVLIAAASSVGPVVGGAAAASGTRGEDGTAVVHLGPGTTKPKPTSSPSASATPTPTPTPSGTTTPTPGVPVPAPTPTPQPTVAPVPTDPPTTPTPEPTATDPSPTPTETDTEPPAADATASSSPDVTPTDGPPQIA